MHAFAELILSNEQWLLTRAVDSKAGHKLMPDLAPPPQAWQMAYIDLRDALLVWLCFPQPQAVDPFTQRRVDDAFMAFASRAAQRHLARGISADQFMLQLKVLRDVFVELCESATAMSDIDVGESRKSIFRFFDLLEVTIFSSLIEQTHDERMQKLQTTNLHLTNVKNKYLEFFDSHQDAAALLDRDGNIVNVNIAFANQFDMPSTCIASAEQNPDDAWPLPWLKNEIAALQSSHNEERRFVKLLDTKGGERCFDVKLKVLRNIVESFVGTLILLVDVTDREQFETELKHEKERAQNYLDVAGAIIVALDRDGNVSMLNRMGHQLLGYHDQDIIGQNWFNLVLPEGEREHIKSVFQAVMSGRGDFDDTNENRVMARDGTELTIAWYNTLLHDNLGQIVGTLSSGLDVTARRKAEIELSKRACALEDINEEIRNFSYIVSHDLKTPLVNVRGYTRELRRAINEMSVLLPTPAEPNFEKCHAIKALINDDIFEALEFIDSSVTRIDKFNNSVLKLSRAGRNPLSFETVDPHRIVSDVLQSLSHALESCGATVEIKPLPYLVSDVTSLEQIFGNLLSNSVKYRHGERPLSIEISAQDNQNDVVFSVADNGIGIARDAWNKVFLPFRRAVGDEIPGEGMGLAYVRALVRKLQGTVWFDSEPGAGTTFFFAHAKQHRLGTQERSEL